MRAMLEDIAPRLEAGRIIISKNIKADNLKEGDIAIPFGEIAKEYHELSFGSYPWFNGNGYGAQLVVRGFDKELVNKGVASVLSMLEDLGLKPIVE